MAATPEVTDRVERCMAALFAQVKDLPGVAAEWAAWPDQTRASVSLDWDHLTRIWSCSRLNR